MTKPEAETYVAGAFIASTRIEGASVYRRGGQRVGRIKRIVLNKLSGQVEHVVVSHGGTLGIGERYHSVAWSDLSYNAALKGYEVQIADMKVRRS